MLLLTLDISVLRGQVLGINHSLTSSRHGVNKSFKFVCGEFVPLLLERLDQRWGRIDLAMRASCQGLTKDFLLGVVALAS